MGFVHAGMLEFPKIGGPWISKSRSDKNHMWVDGGLKDRDYLDIIVCVPTLSVVVFKYPLLLCCSTSSSFAN